MNKKIDSNEMKIAFPTIKEKYMDLVIDAYNEDSNMKIPYRCLGEQKK